MKNKKIIITGGTGFIGQGLARLFGKDNQVVILSRQVADHESNFYGKDLVSKNESCNVSYCYWDGANVEENWLRELDGADLVINLAGKSVNCRYHRSQKKAIIESRTLATKAIGKALAQLSNPPALWINAASATIYRHTFERPNDEFTGIISELKKDNMPFNLLDQLRRRKNMILTRLKYGKSSEEYESLEKDFSVKVCRSWEETFFLQSTPHTRKIALRTAIVLGENGVIIPFLRLCKFGLGGVQGKGNQMFSWVHIRDMARMIEWLMEKQDAEGIYNCVAPKAITNKEFMQTLRKATGHVFGLPAPALLLECGAFMIRTETELMLKSRWVYPGRALEEGFQFEFPAIEMALRNIVEKIPRKQYHLF